MRVVTLSDTHIRRGSKRRLPDAAYEAVAEADVILHAGDIMVVDVLRELEGFAPTHAVLGNNDDGELAGMLPETLTLDLARVRVAMIHDSGPTKGRPVRMRRLFPDADLVVYGHSHIPFDGAGHDGQWLHNPGSATERRAQPHHTIGVIDLDDGRIVRTEIRVVSPPAG
jgi:uncharacterized protein